MQAVNQYLKSNTGKMFERLIGLTLAYSLMKSDSKYCVLPFRTDTFNESNGLKKEDFAVDVVLGDEKLLTTINADLIAFDPDNLNDEIFMKPLPRPHGRGFKGGRLNCCNSSIIASFGVK